MDTYKDAMIHNNAPVLEKLLREDVADFLAKNTAGRMLETLERAEPQRASARRAVADAIGMLLRTRWAGGPLLARKVSDSVPRLSWLPLREVSDYLLHGRTVMQQRLPVRFTLS